MQPLIYVSAVIQHTPVWVWGVLILLLAMGIAQSRPRHITLPRAAVLPLVMLALSLSGVLSAFAGGEPLAAWLAGVVLAALGIRQLGFGREAAWLAAEQRFRVPGSWWPLALMLAIFFSKFVVAVTLIEQPQLRDAPVFEWGVSLLYGVFSGVFAGRAWSLMDLRRQPRAAVLR